MLSHVFIDFRGCVTPYTHIFFNTSLAEHDMSCLSKQCSSRSVGFWKSQTGLDLHFFVIIYVNFYQNADDEAIWLAGN